MSFNSFENLYDGRYLSPLTVIHTENDVLKSFIKILYAHTENIYGHIRFHVGMPEEIKAMIYENFGEVYTPHPEGYAIR
ncbi:MAG: hypothetical protein MJZ22_05210, partial [Candidatus Saccharibacteria bacterium]|nr:hypothetical protein [Candidatus Saccharibacteria bacterium]